MFRTEWTEDRTEKLKELWLTNITSSDIGEQLGGMTGSMVRKKAQRLGLEKRPTAPAWYGKGATPKPKPERKPKQAWSFYRRVTSAPSFPESSGHPDPLGPWNDFAPVGTCQFPHGDPGATAWRMCAHPSDGLYCAFHEALCFTRPKQSQDEEAA